MVDHVISIGSMIVPRYENIMLTRHDGKEYIRFKRNSWCIVVGIEKNTFDVFYNGIRWIVPQIAVVNVNDF